jgi:hypothetical protein
MSRLVRSGSSKSITEKANVISIRSTQKSLLYKAEPLQVLSSARGAHGVVSATAPRGSVRKLFRYSHPR